MFDRYDLCCPICNKKTHTLNGSSETMECRFRRESLSGSIHKSALHTGAVEFEEDQIRRCPSLLNGRIPAYTAFLVSLTCWVLSSLIATAAPASSVTSDTVNIGSTASVLSLMPADHSLYFHATFKHAATHPKPTALATTALTHFMDHVCGGVGKQFAEPLGFSQKRLAAFHLSADLRSARQGLGDVIVAFDLNQSTELEKTVRAIRQKAGANQTGILQTEMINDQIVFVHPTTDWAILQVSPTRLMVASRSMMKRITKLPRNESLAVNANAVKFIKENKKNCVFEGFVAARKGTELPFEFMQFVCPVETDKASPSVRGLIRTKSKRSATALSTMVTKNKQDSFPDIEFKQNGNLLEMSATPSRQGFEALLDTSVIANIFLTPPDIPSGKGGAVEN